MIIMIMIMMIVVKIVMQDDDGKTSVIIITINIVIPTIITIIIIIIIIIMKVTYPGVLRGEERHLAALLLAGDGCEVAAVVTPAQLARLLPAHLARDNSSQPPASSLATHLAGEPPVAPRPGVQPPALALLSLGRGEGGGGGGGGRGAAAGRRAGRGRHLAHRAELLGAEDVVPEPGAAPHHHAVLLAVSVARLAL